MREEHRRRAVVGGRVSVLSRAIKVPLCDRNHIFGRWARYPAPNDWTTLGIGVHQLAVSSTHKYPSRSQGDAASLIELVANPQFVTVTIFCAVGLLFTLNLIMRLPDLGALLS
jgi:hypothetical protein